METNDQGQTEQQQADEADLLPSLNRAASAAAEKDALTTQALTELRNTRKWWKAVAIVVMLGIGYISWQAHDQNVRSSNNAKILVCSARGVDDVLRDVRTLAQSSAKAPESAYALPPGCSLAP